VKKKRKFRERSGRIESGLALLRRFVVVSVFSLSLSLSLLLTHFFCSFEQSCRERERESSIKTCSGRAVLKSTELEGREREREREESVLVG